MNDRTAWIAATATIWIIRALVFYFTPEQPWPPSPEEHQPSGLCNF